MSSPGTTNLPSLLATMQPTLEPTTYLFSTLNSSSSSSSSPTPTLLEALAPHLAKIEMLFREREGWTLIASQTTLDALGPSLVRETAFPCKKITLGVHSSLDAVGFMAAVTTKLAQAEGGGMGVNPVSGFYHDHLFVPEGKEDIVVDLLKGMAKEAAAEVAKE